MAFTATVIGGVAGAAVGGPAGAVIGALAGRAVDLASIQAEGEDRPALRRPGKPSKRTQRIEQGIYVLCIGVARADGHIDPDALSALRKLSPVASGDMEFDLDAARALCDRDNLGEQGQARRVARLLGRRRSEIERVVDRLFAVARADGVISPREAEYIREIAKLMGLTDAEFDRLLRHRGGINAGTPYAILGVARDATFSEVKAAYRNLTRINHPDRLVAAGKSRQEIELANHKLTLINDAFTAIMKERGIAVALPGRASGATEDPYREPTRRPDPPDTARARGA